VLVEAHKPNHKGNVAELAITTEAANLGLSVLKPLTEHEVYDLVHVHVGRSRTSRRGYLRTTYEKGEIDALAAYRQDLHRCYLLPEEMVVGKYVIHLRVSPARNKQRAAINFAKDYELGAVAQGKSDVLAARRAWVRIPPAPLSKPTLKFPDADDFADLRWTPVSRGG
jgi:PD-(D/E)XK endonuclease